MVNCWYVNGHAVLSRTANSARCKIECSHLFQSLRFVHLRIHYKDLQTETFQEEKRILKDEREVLATSNFMIITNLFSVKHCSPKSMK